MKQKTQNFYVEVEKADVASVAVKNGDKLLMGTRRDNGRWTLPGGHLEAGEDPKEGAKRELFEEAGIEAKKIKHIVSKDVTTFTGKKLKVHGFVVEHDGKTSTKNDPDKEVDKWHWIDTKKFPKHILENLHSPKNVVLEKLGIQKALEQFFIKAEKGATIADHKYIRRYMRGGKWVYVYSEPGQPARALPEEALSKIKRLKELGDEHARRMLDETHDVPEEKLSLLRRMADLGDKEAHEHLKHHFAIDREGERLEEDVVPRKVGDDPIHQPLAKPQAKQAHKLISEAVSKKIYRHLEQHQTNPLFQRLSGVPEADVLDKIKSHGNLHGMLTEFHKQMGRIDEAHSGLESANSDVKRAGGYGNLTYNAAIARLEAEGLLPAKYSEVHKRTGASEDFEPHEIRAHERKMEERKREAERKAAEEQKRLEREVGALARTHGKSIVDMMEYWGRTITLPEKRKAMQSLDKIFGKDFSFDSFVKHATKSVPGVEVKLRDSMLNGLIRGDNSLGMYFDFRETSTGEHITDAQREVTKKEDGSLVWTNSVFARPNNDYLKKYPGMAKGLYSGVERFLKEVTKSYPAEAKKNSYVYIGAVTHGFGNNNMKGCLVWAKHYYDFYTPAEASGWKTTWKRELPKYARALGLSETQRKEVEAKIEEFKYPYQFVSTGIRLTKEQALRATGRTSLDFDFEQILQNKGTIDMGELISVANIGTQKYKNYFNRTGERAGHLNSKRDDYYSKQPAARRRRRAT